MTQSTDLGMLLLHALPLDGRMWQNQLQIMPERTVVPNLYDFGNDINSWAAMSVSHVPQSRFIVVGCSVGGSCALEVINLVPDRVAAVILIGTKARCDPDPISYSEACETVVDQGVAGAWDRYWKPLFESDGISAIAQRAKEIALDQSTKGLMNGLDAFYTRPSREHVVTESKVPIHIVTGDRDELPGLNYSRRLATLSDNARLHVIKDCGHYVPMMQPKALNELIADVIRDADADSVW